MFEFQYSLSEKDYIEFNNFYTFNSPANKKSVSRSRWFLSLMCILLSFTIFPKYEMNYILLFFAILILGIGLVWFVFFKSIIKFFVAKNVKDLQKAGKLPYSENIHIKFEENVIAGATEKGNNSIYYNQVERIYANKNYVFIFIGVIEAFILPNSVFESDEQKEGLLKFIEEKTNVSPDYTDKKKSR